MPARRNMSHHSEEILEELRKISAPVIEGLGFEIVDLRLIRTNRRFILRFLVDRPKGGISLDECSRVNEEISSLLEARDILGGESYLLEVSSPGVDRALLTSKDFVRASGRRARIFLNQPLEGKWELEGLVEAVRDDYLFLKLDEKTIKLSLTKIKKAKQVI